MTKTHSPNVYHSDRPFYQVDRQYYDPKVLNLIEPGSRVLDIGCGRGEMLKMMRDLKQCEVMGIDISEDAAVICWGKDIRCIRDDAETDIMHKYEVMSTFKPDYVLLIMSLEHMVDPKQMLRTVSVILRDKGHVVIGVPNFSFWLWRWYYLRGKNAKKFSHPTEKTQFMGIQSDGHLQMFTKESLEYLLQVTGFVPVHWAFDRAPAMRCEDPQAFQGPLNGIRRRINNWMWVPLYNALPYRALTCNFLLVEAQKI